MIVNYSRVVMFLVGTQRKNTGNSQHKMAEQAGVSQQSWARFERGEGGASLDYIAPAVAAFGFTMLQLITATDLLCALLEKNDVTVRGFGYKTYAHLPGDVEEVSFDVLREKIWDSPVGKNLFLGAPIFGGLVGACTAYLRDPEQFNSRIALLHAE